MPFRKRSLTPVRKNKKHVSKKKIFNIPINDFSFLFVPTIFFIVCSIIFYVTGEPPLKDYAEGSQILIPIIVIGIGINLFKSFLEKFL